MTPHSDAVGRRSAAADPGALLALIEAQTRPLFCAMEWAEAEIAASIGRNPAQADLLYHAFGVLTPSTLGPGMGAEFVYRGHVRELLNRVSAGADLRPATAAEICLALSQISQLAPLHGSGMGLYARMWLAAFPGHPITADLADNQSHYEHLHGPHIDDLETRMRHQVGDPDRHLGAIECQGRHHGRDIACRFADGRSLNRR